MSESNEHKNLVKLIIREVIDIVGVEYACFIETDIIDDHPIPKLTNEGYRPDVMYEYEDCLIIGEAKTSMDVEREHSIKQYKSYIKKCALFKGKSILILAVPWLEYATVFNIIKKIKQDYPGNYTVKILQGIGIR